MAKKDKMITETEADDLKKLLEGDEIEDVREYVSTGSTLLDYAISNRKNGGIPVGRVTELMGENASGKTLIATHILANTQKRDGIAIMIDTEHDFDKEFSYRVGLNWGKMAYKEWLPSIEEVFGYIEKIIIKTRLEHKDKLVTIVWDSIGATPAAVELENGSYDPTKLVGLHARIMSSGLRKIRSAIKSERIALVCTNQLRQKIGGMSFGDNTTTSHGKAMSFYASLRIKLARIQQLKDSKDGRIVGAYSEAKIIKNKVAPAWRTVTLPILYDYGIDDETSIFEYLQDYKEITGTSVKTMMINGKEFKFRNHEWKKLIKTNIELNKYVYDFIDKKMIITFSQKDQCDNTEEDSIIKVDPIKEESTEA